MRQAMETTDADSGDARPWHFPQGIAGFPDARDFGLIYEGRGDVACLQCMDRPEAAFLLTLWDEARLGPPPALDESQKQCLDLAEEDETIWMLVLNPFADPEWVTANLRAPIAFNPRSRRALQLVRADDELELRYRWMPQPPANPEEARRALP